MLLGIKSKNLFGKERVQETGLQNNNRIFLIREKPMMKMLGLLKANI